MTTTPTICDRAALLRNRQRAARNPVLFLHEDAATEIEERLEEVNKPFTSPALVGHIAEPLRRLFPHAPTVDDSNRLDLKPESFDLLIHSFGLHWSNDPVGQLVQSRLALKPDGLFLGVLFGGTTLHELRASIAEAETKLTGGLSPRVLPMGDLRDLGGLLGRAGLALPVADTRKLTVRYPSLARLVDDLRGMGEGNALVDRRRTIPPRGLFSETEKVYRTNFSDSEGFLLATFEMIFLTGWAPSQSQQKPLSPGSAQQRLADALGVQEQVTGDTVPPNES